MPRPTVAQRILVHLSLFSRFLEEYECPSEVSQKGISSALGLSRSHVALELKKLLKEGQLETRLAHVTGAKSRRKVYFLALSGERIAASMKERARNSEARWIDVEGRIREGRGAELLQLCRGLDRPMTSIYGALLEGEVVDLREERLYHPAVPAPDIVGRLQELEQLRRWLKDGPPMLVLEGLPGIGKTLLARGLFHEVDGGLWIQVFPFHGASSLFSSIAHGLASRGRPRLLSYLRGQPPDLVEVGMLLTREVAGNLLVFDDVTSTSASHILRLFLENPPPGCKVLLTARRRPDFLKAEDFLSGTVDEMTLSGLTLEESREFLGRLGRREDEVERIYEITRGHPLLLKLTAASSAQPRAAEVEASFLDEVLAELGPTEEEIITLASVFRRPVPPEALQNAGVRALRSLVKSGLLMRHGELYEVHDILAPLIRRHSGRSLKKAHLHASRFWRSRAEWMEVLYHLAATGRGRRLLHLAEERIDGILEQGQASELLELLEGLPGDWGAPLLYLKARALDYLGRWTQALLNLEKGIEGAPSTQRILMLLLRGRLHSKRGEFTDAKEVFEAAADLSLQEGRKTELGMARYGLGIVQRKMGDLERASTFMQEALDIFATTGADAELGRARMEMGVIHLQADNPEDAVNWFDRSKGLLSAQGVDSAYLNNNLGIAYSKLSRPEDSLKAFEESIRLAENVGMVRAEGYALANASDVYIGAGQIERAQDYCERSLKIFVQLGDPVMISACYANQAKAERATGNLAKAERLYGESLRTLEGTKAPYSLAARWLEVSDLYEEMGKSSKASELRSRAHDLLKEDRTSPTRS